MSLQTREFEDGYEQGLQKGFQDGIQRGQLEALKKQLIWRLGRPSHKTLNDLDDLSDDEIGALTQAVFEFSCLDDLSRWLYRVGFERGLLLARLEFLQKQLSRRFGQLDGETVQKLKLFRANQLDELSFLLHKSQQAGAHQQSELS